MKKKLTLKEVAVKSFVTQVGQEQHVKGGSGDICRVTNESCQHDYISCNPWECVATAFGEEINCNEIVR